jgi:hypothetical protein
MDSSHEGEVVDLLLFSLTNIAGHKQFRFENEPVHFRTVHVVPQTNQITGAVRIIDSDISR